MNEQKNSEIKGLPVDVELIVLGSRIGIIANAIAKRLDISGMLALNLFYSSDTCKRLHNKATGLYLFGELYIADDFILEMQAKDFA